MIRTLAVLVAFAGVGGAALPAPEPAPAPRPKKPVLYFPTTVGTKWVYQFRFGKDMEEIENVVTDVKEKDGVYIVTTASRGEDGKLDQGAKTAVSESGLARVRDEKVKFDSRSLILKLPHKEGISWVDDELEFVKVKYTQGKSRLVKVPAGEFEAIPVESFAWVEREPGRSHTSWYAPGIGMVKYGELEGPGIVLKSFTPGKEPAPKDKK